MTQLSLGEAKKALAHQGAGKAHAAQEKAVYHGPGSHTIPNEVIFGKKDGVQAKQKHEIAKPHSHGDKPMVAPVDERHTTPMFTPMDVQNTEGHDGHPVHVLDVTTRFDVLKGQFDVYSSGIYRNYILMWACVILSVLSAFISPYVAAVFAYLAGHFHSERLIANAWEIEWWKGKSVVYTK